MKYFTPDLVNRYGSLDDEVADAADQHWENAVKRYRRRLERILPALPAGVRRWRARAICLHDARVLRLGREGDQFLMVVEPTAPAGSLVVLAFTLAGEPAINPAALPGGPDSTGVEWLYEEWDLDRHQRCWFEVLLSNGWSIRLPFRAFEFRVVQKLLPSAEVPTRIGEQAAASLSA